MKKNIHPNWHDDCQVKCTCGNTFVIGSTAKTLEVDICNECHPFFSGEMKFVDRQGRVDKFKQKMEHAKKKSATQQKSKTAKPSGPVKSYRQILQDKQSTLRKAKSTTPEAKPKS
jgi:large subunit ribosomal protein L31